MTRRRREIAARYDQIARGYAEHWAPLLLSLSEPLVRAVSERLRDGARVLDLGCGTGALGSAIASRGGRVVGVDGSAAMLGQAPRTLARAAGDIERLPLADASVCAVVCTFVLQHLPSPSRAFAEAARAVRPGGVLATATWAADSDETGGPYDLMAAVLDHAGAGPDPGGGGWHARVNAPAKMRRYARVAGLRTERAWVERRAHRWTPETFLGWATSMGWLWRRLETLDQAARARAVSETRAGLRALSREELTWRPEVVFLLAAR
jgi:SAM-dependent methyltransferase